MAVMGERRAVARVFQPSQSHDPSASQAARLRPMCVGTEIRTIGAGEGKRQMWGELEAQLVTGSKHPGKSKTERKTQRAQNDAKTQKRNSVSITPDRGDRVGASRHKQIGIVQAEFIFASLRSFAFFASSLRFELFAR
jgi:hypothetical protein